MRLAEHLIIVCNELQCNTFFTFNNAGVISGLTSLLLKNMTDRKSRKSLIYISSIMD